MIAYVCIILLDTKGCICHFVKWQIHPFVSNGMTYMSARRVTGYGGVLPGISSSQQVIS